MGIVQIRKRKDNSTAEGSLAQTDSPDWIKFAAGGALIAGGMLLLANKPKAGMLVGAAGTGLAIADQQDAVRNAWNQVPAYIDKIQKVIAQVQDQVDAFSAKRDSLHRVLSSFGKGA
jgi:hypothetical protein